MMPPVLTGRVTTQASWTNRPCAALRSLHACIQFGPARPHTKSTCHSPVVFNAKRCSLKCRRTERDKG
eukprot:scaffold41750_cov63-Phaeocystis_antarctica.AAC.2